MVNSRIFLIMSVVFAVIGVPANAQLIGNATPLSVNILGVVGLYADTGQLSASGGSLTSSVASLSLTTGGALPTTVVTTGLLTGNTVGSGGTVDSDAHVQNLAALPGLTPALTLVKADLVESFAHASGGSRSGSVNITNLQVLGSTVTVTGSPNQSYIVPGVLNLTINRQFINSDSSLTVQALYLDIIDPLRAGTIIVSSSTAGVVPEPSTGALVALGALLGVSILHRRKTSST